MRKMLGVFPAFSIAFLVACAGGFEGEVRGGEGRSRPLPTATGEVGEGVVTVCRIDDPIRPDRFCSRTCLEEAAKGRKLRKSDAWKYEDEKDKPMEKRNYGVWVWIDAKGSDGSGDSDNKGCRFVTKER